MLARTLCFTVAFVSACASSTPQAKRRPPPEVNDQTEIQPAQVVRDAESGLATAPWVVAKADITASGAVAADVDVTVTMMRGNRLRFAVTGTFADKPLALCYVSNGEQIRNGDASGAPTPAELNEAVVIGWVRMGLLHNVAMLSGGRGPDRADGGVAEWVRTSGERWAPPRVSPAANEQIVEFDLEVSGQPVGRVSLNTDATTGLPNGRVQVVRFPEGEMRVSESYRFARDAAPTEADFVLTGECP